MLVVGTCVADRIDVAAVPDHVVDERAIHDMARGIRVDRTGRKRTPKTPQPGRACEQNNQRVCKECGRAFTARDSRPARRIRL
jgi:hypothetical protein